LGFLVTSKISHCKVTRTIFVVALKSQNLFIFARRVTIVGAIHVKMRKKVFPY
jgi:hypothetical protein